MPAFRAAPVRVRVPATTANLGPAFDTAALALGLYDDVVVRVADTGLLVDIAGEGADNVPRTERHLVVRAARAAFARLGGQPRGLEVVCANRIPHGRGLGSSAAAICAGILAARAVTLGGESLLDDAASFALAAELEGHPDNVAACLRGGLTLAWRGPSGPRVLRLTPAADLVPVVFVPEKQLSTARARAMLPETVPHGDAATTVGRAALLVAALTGHPELLLDATEDRLHQPYRAPAMPATAKLVERLRADGLPAVVSGGGPSILVLTSRQGADDVTALAPRRWVAHRLRIDLTGATVGPLRALAEPGEADRGEAERVE